MIDMPGYGFAFVDDAEREQWRELVNNTLVFIYIYNLC